MAGTTGKIRVHALAKQLGMSSKELVLRLNDLGIIKVAQSTLTDDEVAAVRTSLDEETDNSDTKTGTKSGKKGAKKAAKKGKSATDEVSDEKLRHRIRKNVENEIHQIEAKVERELSREEIEELVDELEIHEPQPEPPAINLDPIFIAPSISPEEADDFSDDDSLITEFDTDFDLDAEPSPRKRGSRGTGRGKGASKGASKGGKQAKPVEEEPAEITEPVAIKGSTRLEAQRRRRTNLRTEGRKKRHVVSQAEFLARRESVDRVMVVRERRRNDDLGNVTQVGVLEDDLLVEHFVTSETQNSTVGNIYLGRVQNVLPSMEAAFIDIGTGRNGVLYAGEVDWRAAGLGGRNRNIEQALKPGDQVLVQVAKDPVGQKGARLTTQISLAGRYLVYVPHGNSTGISRKLPEDERRRLRDIVKEVVPANASAIIRTAAEGVSERDIAADVERLQSVWESIESATKKAKNARGTKPRTLYEEPDMLVKIVRDVFNEDFSKLIVEGQRPWTTVKNYVETMAPDLMERVERYQPEQNAGVDVFERYRIDEQLHKALSRKVWLPSGGTLIIDRTEAMTVIDVNTGKFTGSGGNLEETVTRNNLEAAEEIVRQMRLRDLGGMIVVDFIDMVLPENQELVLRRLREFLGRDRTRHQVSEVTSLGLVQMTRKKLGQGLLETFATTCECCNGSGVIVHADPVEHAADGITPISPEKAAKRKAREEKKPAKSGGKKLQIREDDLPPSRPEPTVEEPADTVDTDTIFNEPEQSIVDIAIAAVATAESQDPDDEFGKVLRKWEDNPRRRRATRGNSRSDRRPEQRASRRAEKRLDPKAENRTATVASPSEGDADVRVIRGRRRAVRRPATAAVEPKSPVKNQSAKSGSKSSAKSGAKTVVETPVVNTRKRRRAVLKTRG